MASSTFNYPHLIRGMSKRWRCGLKVGTIQSPCSSANMARQNGKKFRASAATDANGKGWIAHELAGCEFQDVRLTKRFAKLFRQLSDGVGESIPWACQDWTSTKAAYRFFANGRVSESAILGGHFQATQGQIATGVWPILMLHDTTEFSFHRKDVAAVGMTVRMPRENWTENLSTTMCAES